MERKLYRSRDDRMIAGVCGGLGEYFDIDPTLIRVGLAILTLASIGTFILLYIIMAIIIPQRPFDDYAAESEQPAAEPSPEMKPAAEKLEAIEDQAKKDMQ
jgi:phage shock protein C